MAKAQEKNFFTIAKELNGEVVEEIVEEKDEKARRFFALRRVQRMGDYHPAYQIEMVTTQSGKVLQQCLVGKPDTLAMVTSKLQDILDPRNSTENDNETNAILG